MQNRIFYGNSFLNSDLDDGSQWRGRSGRQAEKSKTLDFCQLLAKKTSGLRLDNRLILGSKR